MASFSDTKGLLATIIFHGTILFLLLFFSFSTPKDEDQLEGILVNFGTEEAGSGNEEPEYNEESIPEPLQTASQPEDITEELLTQEEDSPIEEYIADKPKPEKDIETANNSPIEQETKHEDIVKKRTADPRFSFTSGINTSSNSSKSQGITEGTGNQGGEDGSINSDNYTGGGLGDGIVASLVGRKGISLPSPSNKFQEEGIVVVEITVDRNGKVIKAIPGVKKTTNLDATLLRLAKEAAYKSKFNVKPDAPVLQKGTITYNFRLK